MNLRTTAPFFPQNCRHLYFLLDCCNTDMAMRARWKSTLSDSLLHLAVILSILRTDLRVYLRQYSQYPEVQQALLGQSVGLHLVDNYHNNDLLPLPSSKYITDEREQLHQELDRLVGFSRLYHTTATISAWLVTNSSQASANISDPTTELSQQDVELIELLWKEDVGELMNRNQFNVNSKELGEGHTSAEGLTAAGGLFEQRQLVENALPWPSTSTNDGSLDIRPAYNAQNSLDLELQDLEPMVSPAANNSIMYPLGHGSVTSSDPLDLDGVINDSSVMWREPDQMAGNDFPMDFELDLPLFEDMRLSPSFPHDMDLDFLSENLLESAGSDRDSVSEDSAVGSSPPQSWCGASSSGDSERNSFSSSDPFDLEDGAVGYTKTEPFDKDYYDFSNSYSSKRGSDPVSHDHTYGAPPGGVPHVRKMDMKTTKEPSRGQAHDEVLCKKNKIPFSVDTIINSPMDEFNLMLQSHKLTARQVTLVKDIRRRGKNKVAAQNCRQKRVGEHSELEMEVSKLREVHKGLSSKHKVLMEKTQSVRKHVDIMSAEIFNTLRDENGMPYNTSTVSLEIGGDGEIHVTSTARTQRSRGSRKRDTSKRRR